MGALTGQEARQLRTRNGWSLQEFANRASVNKAYLSEFENGLRKFNDATLERLLDVLEQRTVGHARPQIHETAGHARLAFVNEDGVVLSTPRIAHLTWVEDDGTSYTMYIGER